MRVGGLPAREVISRAAITRHHLHARARDVERAREAELRAAAVEADHRPGTAGEREPAKAESREVGNEDEHSDDTHGHGRLSRAGMTTVQNVETGSTSRREGRLGCARVAGWD